MPDKRKFMPLALSTAACSGGKVTVRVATGTGDAAIGIHDHYVVTARIAASRGVDVRLGPGATSSRIRLFAASERTDCRRHPPLKTPGHT